MPKKWSKKYKRSIDCNNPKGFSQKAHCAGRKKKESKMSSKLEELVGKPITEEQFDEAAGEKDACYRKVKARYDVWPSAYASGALVKCRKVGAKNWGNKSKKEGVYEKNKGKTLYGKDLVNYFVKRFKYSTRDATAVANKLKDVGFKVPKVLPFNESVNEVDAVTQKKIDKLVADKKKVIDRQKKVKDFQMKNQMGNRIDNYNKEIRKLRGESVNEAVSPKGWNMSKKYISFIDREVKKLKKYHMQQNEEDFLEVANYIELQLKQMKKDLNESVNERTDSQAKKNLMRALKNSKVADVFSYDNNQIAIEMTNGDDYIVGNIQS